MNSRIWKYACFILALTMVFGVFQINTSYAKVKSLRKIVVFEQNVDDAQKNKVLMKHNAIKIKEIKGINGIVVEVNEDSILDGDASIRYVEVDYKASISSNKSKGNTTTRGRKKEDPIVVQPEEVIPWGVAYVGAPDMWSITSGEGIRVAVIDTGIDLGHLDLVDNIKGGINTIRKNKSYDDDNGHGTHVAGVVGAIDNDIGVIGVLPEVELFAVKALDSNGDGYVSDIIEGIEWSIDNDMDIINMSFGITDNSDALHEIVMKASELGIIMVAAAGNNFGGNSEYPATYDEVIAVGAIDINGDISAFSALYGVDVWAPGEQIYSTYIGNSYKTESGTSMAAPHWIYNIITSY